MHEAHIGQLLDRSFELRHSKPAESKILAHEATVLAERLPKAPSSLDLQGKSWAYLGNALRVCNDLSGAERAFLFAWARLRSGTGQPRLIARVHELHASLLEARRTFMAADGALSAALRLHEEHGDQAGTTRCLVQRANIAGNSGDPERAISYLFRALPFLRHCQEALLKHAAFHNLAWFLVDIDRADLAQEVILERDLAPHPVDELLSLRTKWLRARIMARQGGEKWAEEELLAVRLGFLARSLWYDAALAALELAALQSPSCALDSLKGVQELFEQLGIQREADAAFLLREAMSRVTLACELVPRIAFALRVMPLERVGRV